MNAEGRFSEGALAAARWPALCPPLVGRAQRRAPGPGPWGATLTSTTRSSFLFRGQAWGRVSLLVARFWAALTADCGVREDVTSPGGRPPLLGR